jgi:hypothetical protein
MVVSYETKQTKDNEVARSKESGSVTNYTPTKTSPTMVADEFPTPQVRSLQLCEIFRGNERGTEHYNDLYHLNSPSADDGDVIDVQSSIWHVFSSRRD